MRQQSALSQSENPLRALWVSLKGINCAYLATHVWKLCFDFPYLNSHATFNATFDWLPVSDRELEGCVPCEHTGEHERAATPFRDGIAQVQCGTGTKIGKRAGANPCKYLWTFIQPKYVGKGVAFYDQDSIHIELNWMVNVLLISNEAKELANGTGWGFFVPVTTVNVCSCLRRLQRDWVVFVRTACR